jgi:2-methylcitrate dehydratase PrpD
VENVTTIFSNNLRLLCSNIDLEKHYYDARLCLLDYLSCLVGGKGCFQQKLNTSGLGEGVQIDALKYGMYSHVLELDDGHRKGAVHVGAPVFSALIPVALRYRIEPKDFLNGVIAGYEATVRLACAVQPGCRKRGYHASGICGTVGAAIGIATALKFNAEQMNTAIAAAAAGAAGVLEMQEDGSDLKPYNVGRASMDAVVAAMIGKAGLKGPNDAIGGKRGFIAVTTDTPHLEQLTDFDGDTLAVDQVYRKEYAACRHAHPAIEAALKIKPQISISEIENIEVLTYLQATEGHSYIEVSTVSAAKMSIPFSVAVALATGSADMKAFSSENVANKAILDLTRMVEVKEDVNLTALNPQKRAAIVVVHTQQGDYSQRVDYPKGEPENPLSKEELEEKFRGLAMYGGLAEEECDTLIGEIWKEDFSIEKIIKIVGK